MKYIHQEIEDFTYSNITEAAALWSKDETYNVGEQARQGSFVYTSVIDGNQHPINDDTIKLYWLQFSPSNKYAALDLRTGTVSVFAGDLTFIFDKNKIDTLAFGRYTCQRLKVELLDESDSVIWTYATSSINAGVYDWWTYFEEPYHTKVDRAMMVELPSVGKKIKVTLIKEETEDNTSIGFLIGGRSVDMGCTLESIKFGFNSYATKKTDKDGNLQIIKRAVQDIVDFETIIETKNFTQTQKKIKNIYNDIVCFIVDDTEDSPFDNIIVLGTIESSKTILTEYDKTTISWSVLEAV